MLTEEYIIAVYCLVDEMFKNSKKSKLRRRGPQPKLSDVEVITMEIAGESKDLIKINISITISRITGCIYFQDLEIGQLSCVKQRICGLLSRKYVKILFKEFCTENGKITKEAIKK